MTVGTLDSADAATQSLAINEKEPKERLRPLYIKSTPCLMDVKIGIGQEGKGKCSILRDVLAILLRQCRTDRDDMNVRAAKTVPIFAQITERRRRVGASLTVKEDDKDPLPPEKCFKSYDL